MSVYSPTLVVATAVCAAAAAAFLVELGRGVVVVVHSAAGASR